jgi:Hypothetical protein (DUF2513)
MQRNWDVIRAILVRIEEEQSTDSELYPQDFPPIDEVRAAYHARLLHSAGLITGQVVDGIGTSSFIATGLTWQGHELLDAMRSKTVWNKIKEVSRQKGIELSFDAIKVLGKCALESILS